ncbi:MAG: hypothetical protein Q7R30_23640 [Acidobacteriota bacterium]|nr:hypothetical protein [Acidobacteriota bacterium]
MWTVDRLRHPDTAAPLTQFIASNRPLPFEKEAFRVDPDVTIAFTADGLWPAITTAALYGVWAVWVKLKVES